MPRTLLTFISFLWLAALPYEGLWKNTYIDEHAIQPAQVTLKYEWANVFAADRYLASLEEMAQRNASWTERSAWLQDSFAAAGLRSGEVEGDGVMGGATWAHVTPPRSAGTEVILLSANWNSRDEGANLRGIAMLLSLGEFLRGESARLDRARLIAGQNHWAFDIVLVVGEGYIEGLEGFMRRYYDLFPGLIWTALNVDYPGHSFDHIGLFYGESRLFVLRVWLTGRRCEWQAAESGSGQQRRAHLKMGRRGPDAVSQHSGVARLARRVVGSAAVHSAPSGQLPACREAFMAARQVHGIGPGFGFTRRVGQVRAVSIRTQHGLTTDTG